MSSAQEAQIHFFAVLGISAPQPKLSRMIHYKLKSQDDFLLGDQY